VCSNLVSSERVFDKFPKYRTKILLGDFNLKIGKEDIFEPTIGNESLDEISNDFFLICIVGGGVQTGSPRHVGHLLAYCTCPG
jgi:hypothetical protein